MTAKEYLSRLQAAKEDIKRMDERIRAIDASLRNAGSIRYDNVRVQSTPENKLENKIAEKMDIVAQLRARKAQYDRLYVEISDKLDELEPKHRRALKFRYLDERSISWIANRMHYSVDYTYRILLKARQELELKI